MAFEEYTPTPSRAQSLYAVPLRLIDDMILVKKSDIPEHFQESLNLFCSSHGEYLSHSGFASFIKIKEGKNFFL